MERRKLRRLEQSLFSGLPALGADYNVRTRYPLRMQPYISGLRGLQRQLVVLAVVPAHEYLEALGGAEMQRL